MCSSIQPHTLRQLQGKFDRDMGEVSPEDGFQKVYAHVSPLALLTVEIPRGAINSDVDWTNVSSMSLFFSGSVIAAKPEGIAKVTGVCASRAARLCAPPVRPGKHALAWRHLDTARPAASSCTGCLCTHTLTRLPRPCPHMRPRMLCVNSNVPIR